MKSPKPFGYPLYKGMNLRTAKKYINSWFGHAPQILKWLKDLEQIKIGSLYRACNSWNNKLSSIDVTYTSIGKHGQILSDVMLSDEYGGCHSLFNCGVDLPYTYEQVQENLKGSTSGVRINPDGTRACWPDEQKMFPHLFNPKLWEEKT